MIAGTQSMIDDRLQMTRAALLELPVSSGLIRR
jgi:hypothetical protein